MSKKQQIRACVVYARISVAQEASVSVERQIESAQQYAAARGWKVIGTFVDEGVSASYNRPEDRAGWKALMASPEPYDAVIIWKLDRLSRKVIDFHLANRALEERGASLVAVENSIDMGTPDGRLVAGVLAQFAEYEAEAIRARVAAARTHLIRAGRVVGGKVPYGWTSVPAPDGRGFVLAQDPHRIDWVRGMVERVQGGQPLYAVKTWLDESGAPTPTGRGAWVYSTVERILRHPVLAGMTPFNPGNDSRSRGSDVLRGTDGLPVVDESIAIMPVAQWRAMIARLDARDSAQARPRSTKRQTSGLLSGFVWCADCDVRMRRATTQGRPGYKCPVCHQTITNFEDAVIAEFLHMKGERVRWTVVTEMHEGGAAVLPEIEHRLAELGAALQTTDDDDEAEAITEQIAALRKLRREARETTPQTVVHMQPANFFEEDWAAATTEDERRVVLADAFTRITVRPGGRGQKTDAAKLARCTFDWKQPDDLGPLTEG